MILPSDYQISLAVSGGFDGRPKVSAAFDRLGAVISFRCFVEERQVGGGGHGQESASIVEEIISRLMFTPCAHSDADEVMDSSWKRLEVKSGGCAILFEWYHDCPDEWTAANDLYACLHRWSEKFWRQ